MVTTVFQNAVFGPQHAFGSQEETEADYSAEEEEPPPPHQRRQISHGPAAAATTTRRLERQRSSIRSIVVDEQEEEDSCEYNSSSSSSDRDGASGGGLIINSNSSSENVSTGHRRARRRRASPREFDAASSRRALENAERRVFRHFGVFGSSFEAEGRNQPSPTNTRRNGSSNQQQQGQIQQRRRNPGGLWTKSNAIFVTRTLISLVRYPLQTATMYTQFTGREKQPPQSPLRIDCLRLLCRGAPLGLLYQWFNGHHLGVVGTVVSTIFPAEATTPKTMVANVAAHYCIYSLFYGLFRQSVVARLLAGDLVGRQTKYPTTSSALWPGLAWMRDRLLWRGPRGAVLCVYLRDVVGNIAQGIVSFYLTGVFTSRKMVSVYSSVAGISRAARRVVGDALAKIGLPAFRASPILPTGNGLFSPTLSDFFPSAGVTPRGSTAGLDGQGAVGTRRRNPRRARNAHRRGGVVGIPANEPAIPDEFGAVEEAGLASGGDSANLNGSDESEVDVVFENIENHLPSAHAQLPNGPASGPDTSPPLSLPLPPSPNSSELADRLVLAQGDFLVYTRAVSMILGELVAKLAFYPVDSVLIRLMADEAGLTNAGYTGFFSCLMAVYRSPLGLSSLFAGFGSTLLSELAVGWFAAELAHYLCKSAWPKLSLGRG